MTTIFHIDVNSAFLSWEATYRKSEYEKRRADALVRGHVFTEEYIDLRDIASVVGGSEENRHGIVLAKSTKAKEYGIITSEPLVSARRKCPNLVVVKSTPGIYHMYSSAFMDLLRRYAPVVEQFSVDEAFCDFTGTERMYGDLVLFAHKLKDEIYDTLGFTVNIGVSTNKLLAKMASDFKKPNRVHTLFESEIKEKMWPLPVGDLLFAGRSTVKRLNAIGIRTIGDLATADDKVLDYNLKSAGRMLKEYANGVDIPMLGEHHISASKGYSNSKTFSSDITDADTAKILLLSLCETVALRIRADNAYISVVAVSIRDNDFNDHSRQVSLDSPTNITEVIYDSCCSLFDELWDKNPIRQLGVATSKAMKDTGVQLGLFDSGRTEKLTKLNRALDDIRGRYGADKIKRARFVDKPNNK